jgi:hypothetical protein
MIPMADSITPANLPGTYPAYLGYTDGRWPTAPAVRAAHPSARLVTLTVLGGQADGCDCESGDLVPLTAAHWLDQRIQAGQWRPVLYASRDTVPTVLGALPLDVQRAQIRILSAHYGQGQHICSPAACGATFTADGTQWTDTAPGLLGSAIDLSILNDNFFGVVSNVTGIPLDILGMYTDSAGDLFAVGTDADGVLHESKRTAMGVWSAPYQIAGKVGA